MTQVQKFQKVEELCMEIHGTLTVIDYHKLRRFRILRLLDGNYWILQYGHLPLVQKFHDMKVLGLLLLELEM